MRISDWSSDVCSSDLIPRRAKIANEVAAIIRPVVHGFQGRRVIDFRNARVSDRVIVSVAPEYATIRVFLCKWYDKRTHLTRSVNPSISITRNLCRVASCLNEIGQASCRERMCPSDYSSVVAESLK